ncbi:MAG TPA: TetR/AcrR family transcriptional regulator [Acidimicrobiales bacterium]|nr:TetR/AcrR family transcriptional regulator [Acidimicrobiales bacterium]
MPRSRQPVTAAGDNRTRLLELSADLFATQGYARVSVRDLAGRLGLTTGAIYSNFRSKGDLLAEVLDVRVSEDMERSRPEMALPEFVRQSFLRLDERATMRALLLEAAAAARTDATLRARLRPALGALLERWIADYRDWQEIRHVAGRIDMDALVRSLWSIELGLGVLDAQGALEVAPERLAGFVAAFLGSLETSEGPRGTVRPHRASAAAPASRAAPEPTAKPKPATLAPLSGRRDSPKAVATQARLIEAALQLFAQRGYAAVSVRDIARDASMTTGSIYGNFANKANLLVEVIEAHIAQDLEQLPPSLLASSSPAALVEFNFRAFPERRQLRALIVEGAAAARSDPELRGRLQELQHRHLGAWAEGLQELVARHPVAPRVDTTTAVTVAWCAELGLGLMEALDLPTPTAAELAGTFGAMFRVAGLGAPSEETTPTRRKAAR